MPFDPDKYLAEKQDLIEQQSPDDSSSGSFDPDKFLNEKIQKHMDQGQIPPEKVSTMHAAGLGALQGGSLGYADEIEAALKSGHISGPEYKALRDQVRAQYKNAEQQHPLAFGAGGVGGGMLTGGAAMLAAPAMAGIGGAAALGAAAGLGTSDADLTDPNAQNLKEAGKDVALGAGLGAVTGLAGKGLGMLGKAPVISEAAQGLEYGAAGNKPTQEAIEQALKAGGVQKGQLIQQASLDSQRIPINGLNEEVQQGMQSLPKSIGSKEGQSRAELQKILEDAGLSSKQASKALEEGPEGMLSSPKGEASSSPESMSPDDLNALQKALQSLGYKNPELSGTQGAQLAQRLYGKAGAELTGPEGVPGLSDINKSMQQHYGMQDLVKDINPLDILSSPGKVIKKYPAQLGAAVGYGASKVPGAVPAAQAVGELGKAVGETLPITAQTVKPEDIKKSDTAALSRNLYNMPLNDLSPYASRLMQAGGFNDQAQHLQKAIDEGDAMKKNQALFLLLQDPKSRAVLRGE